MKLNLNLSAEIEGVLRRRAAAAGQDVATFVAHVVTEELADQAKIPPTRPKFRDPEEFIAKLEEIIKRHGTRHGHVDDSRESIYAGCGE
jgi:hypothetical protein